MRQRGVGWMGAIAAMVVAGLIVYGIIYWGPDIWRGVQEGASGEGTTSLKSITQNPEAYENQEVTVIGKIIGGWIWNDEGYHFPIINLPTNGFSLFAWLKYKVNGKVVHVQTVLGTEEWAWAIANNFIPIPPISENVLEDSVLDYWAIESSDISKI